MSCITTGYNVTCDNQKAPGGISEIYIIDSQDIDTIDYTTTQGTVTALTLDGASAGWQEVQFKRQSASYTETANGVAPDTVWEQIIALTISKRNVDLRNFIQDLAGCGCGVAVYWVETTGERWISGFLPNQEFLLNENVGTSGALLTDPNQETIGLQAFSSEKAFKVDAAVTIP